ncbi:MAG: hypothetical protein A2X35_00430 [Elusimicrobia bacterium GWA2_61_42]|nr:MAG: hypothetical protein A2X35_00430 [Elusimicrobia bacterium GWA2_61_42]OGR79193.1 MAG: hypothetical protein A2X38_06545 [Elusimicrobia bacterium GWC2_61_25]
MSALCGPANAAEINGGDWHGADLNPANYDILRGTFTNVGNFNVAASTTVLVASGERLAVYAATVTIAGHLNASGSGLPGGAAGGPGLPGSDGFSPVVNGAGKGALATYGGGGGGHADADLDGISGGQGRPAGGGLGGTVYGFNPSLGIPFSVADAYLGSGGGGGGGGGAAEDQSGGGGAGGGAIYIEAGYAIISGTVSANGLPGGVGITTSGGALAGAGGGGSGGGIIIKSAGALKLLNGSLSASGGTGGSAIDDGAGIPNPGGGGAAGRIRLMYNSADFSGVRISTTGGTGGISQFGAGTPAMPGSYGTAGFGLFPSSPAAFTVTDIFKTSAAYAWTGKAGAAWGGYISGYLPAAQTVKEFRLYSSTTAIPFTAYYTGFSAADTENTKTETGLQPNSAIGRMLSAYTDYGDSAPSASVSFITRAADPQGAGFLSAAAGSVTFYWSSGTVADGFNPAYTSYEITRSSVPAFAAAAHTAFTTGISSAPAGLMPNTTYYFRARALGLNAAYTDYTQEFSTPTLAMDPVSPAFTGVFISSVLFSWSGAQNPPGTLFLAQVSQDGFLSVKTSSETLSYSAAFEGLDPGSIYALRVCAVNHARRQTAFTAIISTTAGQFTTLEAPARPEPPQPASAYTYDGTTVFTWAPPAGTVPIYKYLLDIGTTPGGNDFLAGQQVLASGPLSYAAAALVSGKTYYARVRASSSAGVLGEFSLPGSGVAAWAPQAQPAVAKPYNWPNPFNPRQASTSIGFSLAAPARVTLTIYTLQGRRVRELSGSEGSAGNKVWTWDGRNGEGRVVEPGGYLAVIKKDYAAGSDTQRFKIAVLY